MASEIKPWKKPDCSLLLKVSALSDRDISSREINEEYGEAGALNANYRTVEAALIIANHLGWQCGMNYGSDFVFKTGNSNIISFDFSNEETKKKAERIFKFLIAA